MNKRQKKKRSKKIEEELWKAIYKIDLEKKMYDTFSALFYEDYLGMNSFPQLDLELETMSIYKQK